MRSFIAAVAAAALLLTTESAYADDVRQISGGPRGTRSENLTLHIASPSVTFALGQPIDLTGKIQNNSSTTIRVWRATRERITYDVKGDGGRVVPPAPNPPYEEISAGSAGWVLPPNQELNFRIPLNEYVVLDHPGTYTIRIEVNVPAIAGKAAETSVHLISNVLTLTITPTLGGGGASGLRRLR